MPQLFLRFMMTAEGVEPMTVDGKVSGNEAVPSRTSPRAWRPSPRG
ncbi:MAG: hypothetical protein R3D25_13155 [Geminicoccaceae bacterium]